MPDHIGNLYAFVILSGGIFGYYKAGSVPSLAAGIAFGILSLVSAHYAASQNHLPMLHVLIVRCFPEEADSTEPCIASLLLSKDCSSFSDDEPKTWKLVSKYYSVDLLLHTTRQAGIDSFMPPPIRAEAVILHCNLTYDSQSYKLVWKALENADIGVRLLVVSHILDDHVDSVESWCIENNFDFIVLNPDEEMRQEAESFGEVVGIDRLVEVLQANEWCNMIPKKEQPKVTCKNAESSSNVAVDAGESVEAASDSFQALRLDEDSEVMSFSALYQKFSEMKEYAESLPEAERKIYAAHVATQFLKILTDDDEASEEDTS
ncbi:Alpha- and gamma-adaptin-binding protein p34 [Trichinella britovi]|uniref:Alpha-and gamma-adaptin-binding protein p34 n=1 Tax=Trichinella britovi TaxID=45882 RepID=A0A0V1CIJ0_TRIBR|nr:Alpha- and gamma-adaptin-binding protein p34 [Trichinella britovi]